MLRPSKVGSTKVPPPAHGAKVLSYFFPCKYYSN
nr:MAG TPA: hypothetical protein [Caudoviricetes sp.]